MRLGLLGLFLFMLVGGCARGGSERQVLATVGDRKILVSDFEDGYMRVAAQDTSIHPGPEGRRKVLSSMIEKALLETAAKEKYPTFNDNQKDRLRLFREDELRKAIESREVTSKIHVTDEDVRKVWESRDTRYKIRHIFCPTREEAQAAQAMIEQGATFQSVAAAKSRDARTAPDGGMMDWFIHGRGPGEEVEAATMALAPGERSGIIQTAKGFEIIRLEQKEPNPNRAPFESDKREIDLVLRARQSERLRLALRQRLFEKYRVQVTPDLTSRACAWLAASGPRQAPPEGGGAVQMVTQEVKPVPVSASDSASAAVTLRPADVRSLLRAGAFGDSAWAEQRTADKITLADYSRWLAERPGDLWPDPAQPWLVDASLRDMVSDEVFLREALSEGLQNDPAVAARFRDRENRSRVMRFHYFEIEQKVHPDSNDVRRVYEERRDVYRIGERIVTRAFSTPDSSAAIRFADAIRSGKPFTQAASAIMKEQPGAQVTPESAPDTFAVSQAAGEFRPALDVLKAPGQVSGPLRWGQGTFTVFQLVTILPSRPLTFEEARGYAENDARTLAQEQRLKEILDDVRSREKVQVNEALLEKLPDPKPASGPKS